MTKKKDTNWCCFIAEDDAKCAKDARFEIWGSCGPEDNTHACEEHVGYLLGSPEGDCTNATWIVHLLPED